MKRGKGIKGCTHHKTKVIQRFAEGGVVQPTSTAGTFSQGVNKYMNMIQQNRANAQANFQPVDVEALRKKYLPPPPPPPAAATPAPAPAPTQTSSSDRSAAERAAMAPARGSGSFASSGLASRLPGGVNTRNPGSMVNTAAAKMTSRPQRAPTAANRPQSRSSGAGKKK